MLIFSHNLPRKKNGGVTRLNLVFRNRSSNIQTAFISAPALIFRAGLGYGDCQRQDSNLHELRTCRRCLDASLSDFFAGLSGNTNFKVSD